MTKLLPVKYQMHSSITALAVVPTQLGHTIVVIATGLAYHVFWVFTATSGAYPTMSEKLLQYKLDCVGVPWVFYSHVIWLDISL